MKKNNFLIQGYINSYNLIKKAKLFILISTLSMALMILVGFIFPQLFQEQVLKIIQNMIQQLEGKNAQELIIFIFLNNLTASFVGLISGMFFGIFPLIAALTNGYVIGFVSNTAVNAKGIFVLWKLIPHGILEIPAILISLGVGLYLGSRFLERFFKIKSETKRIVIMCFTTLAIVPLAGFYYVWSLKLLEIQANGFSSISSSNLPLATAIGIINLTIIGVFLFITFSFFKDRTLRKDLKDSLVFFILVVLPLLLIAAIIEGYLIGAI